jgi:ribosomal protein L11 methyltransferase
MSGWTEILLQCRAVEEEDLSSLLYGWGAAGTAVEPLNDIVFSDFSDSPVLLRGYFSSREAALKAHSLLAELGRISLIIPVANIDWVEKIKDSFQPIEVAPGVVVCPSWQIDKAPSTPILLKLDPGTAFGTGEHATTRLCCVRLQEAIVERRKNNDNLISVLDVGCGSGILSILAARCQAAAVRGIDNDPAAVETARIHVKENGVSETVVIDDVSIENLNGKYDLVVANILLNTLVEMRASLRRLTAPGGELILSGVTDSQAPELIAAYRSRGWPIMSRSDDGWSLISLKKPAAASRRAKDK